MILKIKKSNIIKLNIKGDQYNLLKYQNFYALGLNNGALIQRYYWKNGSSQSQEKQEINKKKMKKKKRKEKEKYHVIGCLKYFSHVGCQVEFHVNVSIKKSN